MTNTKISFLLTLLLLFAISLKAQLRLPKLVSDGMVLQRDKPVDIWGWASANRNVELIFQDKVYSATSKEDGEWTIQLPAIAAGGPYNITVSDCETTILITDVLFGDVWLCSGQSNMQFVMDKIKHKYALEVAKSENEFIRHFGVPKTYNFTGEQNDLKEGSWEKSDPKSILNFSAAAYFFALELYEKYQIPIGLINASLGGTPAQAWISESALLKFPHYSDEAKNCKDPEYIQQIETKNKEDVIIWNHLAYQTDKGLHQKVPWYSNKYDFSSWASVQLPGLFNNEELKKANGVIWLKRKVQVSRSMINSDVKLKLGRIVNADSVYVNGIFIGATSHQYAIRNYTISKGILNVGENTITIRLINQRGRGGLVMGNSLSLTDDEESIDLSGAWNYKLGATIKALAKPTMLQWKPTGLYNSMIAPLRLYAIRGVIWYQGEGNVNAAKEYATLFPTLINDWRVQFRNNELPFLFVQLANFTKPDTQPKHSAWAMLRESQLKTLSLPYTGMAVTIDIGQWNDIHPLNKKDVGKRLALAAQKVSYNERVIHSGPLYKSMTIDQGKVLISMDCFGSSLMCKRDMELAEFAIAGADQKFVWAKAEIQGNKILVWSDRVKEPLAVRYAWSNNPDKCNLYNAEGLPASPFRTDNWSK